MQFWWISLRPPQFYASIRRPAEDDPVSQALSLSPVLPRCLPPQQPEGLWPVLSRTHPKPGKLCFIKRSAIESKAESFHVWPVVSSGRNFSYGCFQAYFSVSVFEIADSESLERCPTRFVAQDYGKIVSVVWVTISVTYFSEQIADLLHSLQPLSLFLSWGTR